MSIKNRVIAMILAGTISAGMTGCKKQDNSLIGHNDFVNHYDNYVQKDVVENKVVSKYNANNIVIAVNKETNEVYEYLYFAGDAKNYLYQGIDNADLLSGFGFIVELFDLETGELVYFNSEKYKEYNFGSNNLYKLLQENDFYNLYELYEYGIEFKTWYTLDEIREIAQVIVNRNIKIKRLTNN